jgi:hypothetical protein
LSCIAYRRRLLHREIDRFREHVTFPQRQSRRCRELGAILEAAKLLDERAHASGFRMRAAERIARDQVQIDAHGSLRTLDGE